MKNKIIENILNNITQEQISKWEKSKIESHNNLSIDEMLGFFIGQEICRTKLPRLSIDGFLNSIKVSEEDEKEYKKLSNLYSSKYNYKNPEYSHNEWITYRKFAHQIENKYLPNPFIYESPMLNIDKIQNIDEFKNGLINSLWDDDFCYYNLEKENIKIYNATKDGFGVIELIIKQNNTTTIFTTITKGK